MTVTSDSSASALSPTSDAPPGNAPKPAARWEDFIDMFYAPAAVFRRRENQSPWPPILIVTVLIFLVTFGTFSAIQPLVDPQIQRAIAKAMQQQPQMTADQAAMGTHFAEYAIKFGAVLMPIAMLVLGLAVWLVGKIVGSRQTLQAAIVVVSYTLLLLALEGLVNGIQAMVMNLNGLSSIYALQIGPARFADPTKMSPILFTMLIRLNVFVLWRTVLLAIGVRVTGKVSWPSAAFVAVIVWGLATLWQMRDIVSAYG